MSSVQTFLPGVNISDLSELPEVQRALNFINSRLNEVTEEQIRICSIPSPPFGERERAEYLAQKFRDLGLHDVNLDAEGNCVALRPGRQRSPLLVVSGHLDTVFPAGTDVTVRRSGMKLMAPGICDDGCGLAALVALVETFQEMKLTTEGSLLFVGTVGEEGEGNLRGVRHLFADGKWAKQIDAFISFDGAEIDRVTNGALGSRRYRIVFRGIGGHSWGDFGIPNPVHALGRAVSKLAAYPAPVEPRTTFNVGRIEGGASINAIPQEAAMDVDLRSADADELLKLDAFFRRAIREAVEEENNLRRNVGSPLELKVELIGERPSGETSADSPLVRLACEATEFVGVSPRLNRSSTDSNLPISLGIPAITLGAGGTSGNSHALDEWYNPSGREAGLIRALLIILATVKLAR
jgi:tripeptide aminopeptidase